MKIPFTNQQVKISYRQVRIGCLYFILLAGALWNILQVFQQTMRILSAPVIIGLGVWLFFEYFYQLKEQDRLKFTLWSAGVVLFGILVEFVGVKTGWLFGNYQYGEVLKPQIFGVPVAIGFAWLGMLISSVAFTQRLVEPSSRSKLVIALILVGLLMVSIDVFMEPVAIKLNYWYWTEGIVPFTNYLTWFVIGIMLAYAGFRYKVLSRKIPSIAMHAYVAQLLYFILTNLAVI